MTSSTPGWTSFVGPVVGLAGVVIAYWLGRRGKKLDFRFDALQKAAALNYKVRRAAREYDRRAKAARGPNEDALIRPLAQSRETLESCVTEALALRDVLDLLFRETARGHWDRVFENFRAAYRGEKDFTQASEAAVLEYKAFLKIAARKCGLLPWERWITMRKKLLKVSRFGAGDDAEKEASE